MFTRSLQLPEPGTETFFLWGPRQVGKSTLLKERYRDARWVDLLKSEEYRRYLTRPEYLREELEADGWEYGRQIVIDEIQKVPRLLDEVHWLMENRGFHFALCGSSARKMRRRSVNMLGGRAVRYELRGLVSAELGDAFELDRILNHGYTPRMYESQRPRRLQNAYVSDYLKQEIADEGLVRNLPAFSDFLDAAALSDGERVNFSNISRECGVSDKAVKGYFEILEDTLLGRWLSAYRRRRKRRVAVAPKFYFADVGVVNSLARRRRLTAGTELYGKAFENWVYHELSSAISYREIDLDLSFWRLPSGIEVDFIVGDIILAVEAKSSPKITRNHLKGLRTLINEHPEVERRVVVCLEPRARRTADGIEIVPANRFVDALWRGEFV